MSALALVTATVAAFVASTFWYVAWARQLARLHPAYASGERPGPATVGLELLRTLALVVAVSVLAERLDLDTALSGLALGGLLWLGFPLVILSGSVLHEKVPTALAAIHLGDWLVKLVLVAGIVSAWR